MGYSMAIRAVLLASAGIAAAPTLAQDNALATAATDSPGPATAPGSIFGGDIVVTARKKSESLQEVPLAIRALDSGTIEREGLRQVEDLARLVPGLTYDLGGFLNDTRPALRGMQAERGRPSVAVLLDNQDLSGENLSIAGGGASLNTALFDLERIEVVKGPQSTLYGRNAFAGAINYVSRDPSMELEGRVGGEVGNGGVWALEGAINAPIIADRIAIRLNAGIKNRNGFYRNPVTGARLGSFRSEGFGGAILLKPAADVRIVGRYLHSTERMSEAPTAFLGSNTRLPAPGARFSAVPGAPATIPCPPVLTGLTPPQQINCTRGTLVGAISAGESDIQLSADPFTGKAFEGMKMTQDLVSVNASWDADWGTLSYRFGWIDNESRLQQDGDYSNFAAPPGPVLSLSALQDLEYHNRRIDNELRLRRTFGRVDIMVGAQILTEESSLINAAQFWLRSPTSPLAGPPFRLSTAPRADFAVPVVSERNTNYYGVYGSIGWTVTDQVRLTADMRWNYDSIVYTIPGWRSQDVTLSRLRPVCLPQFQNGATFSPANPAGTPPPGVVAACERTARLKSEKLTPRFTVEYRAVPDVMVYASYAQGFKPGGFNTNEVVDFSGQGYQPEKVNAFELGVKSSLLDRSLTLNADVYYNDYTDQQIGVQNTNVSPTGQTVTTAGIVNAGKVRILGFEADVDWRVADRLRFTLGYAFTRSKFDSFIQGPPPGSPAAAFEGCGVPVGQTSSDQNRAEAGNLCADFSGNWVGKSPRHALNLSAEYRQPFGAERDSWFVEASALYRSKRFTDESNLAHLPEYWRFGARAGVEWHGLSLTAYVDNIFDNKRIESAQRNVDFGRPEGFAPGRGFIAYLPNPRTFGLRGAFRF